MDSLKTPDCCLRTSERPSISAACSV